MAGHSKWANIKHKKAKEDAKKGKVFTKLNKEITVAVREGGPDPDGNPRLRLVLEKAKSANMPQDNVTRAIKKASGNLDGVNYESVLYEGYGPFGTAIIVETLTDNKKRTVADVRHLLTKYGGNLGSDGSVSWMFNYSGVINGVTSLSEDDLLEALLDFDLEEIICNEGNFYIVCQKENLDSVKHKLLDMGIEIESSELSWLPKDSVGLNTEEDEDKFHKLIDALEELDDVQDVYTNVN